MKPRYASALALFLTLATLLRAAGPEPPDTPQGARMKALLAAFAAGTPEAVRAFISANFAPSALQQMPLEQRVQRLSGIGRRQGPSSTTRSSGQATRAGVPGPLARRPGSSSA